MARCAVCAEENPERARFCSGCGRPLTVAPPVAETRKTVTVLFADLTGSTALAERLDPEALRALMGRYFATMKHAIESHGGTVEKFIGDAVMAVFGIPQVHEDDALRAVRAADQIRTELIALNTELIASRGIALLFRTGVYTGEVVAGDPSTGQTLVTGDTVNTAARLEQAASPGEILIGQTTWTLIRDAVEVEVVEPILAKGKATPVPALRLIAVRSGARGRRRRDDVPLVGRESDLARLQGVYDEAVETSTARLVTVVGSAGVGKSRLVAELRAAVEGEARILRGRCVSYGYGITYQPIGEIVRAAAGISDADDAVSARARLSALTAGDPDAVVIAERLASAIGLPAEPAPQEEVFWAIRKVLELLGRDRPLVVVIEDIHWAEPTLLELLKHLATQTRGTALLLVCPARPDLLEADPEWAAGSHVASSIRLDALDSVATRRLIAALPGGAALPDAVRDRVEVAAEGNPLFVEELLGMLVDDGILVEGEDGAWLATERLAEVRIPTSISTLLAARLERLVPDERDALARASVIGRVFEEDAVRELSPDALRLVVARSLGGLVRKDLVRPDRSEIVPGEAFRFRHVLIRDAAYEALPKSDRADLHDRFVRWLERVAGDRIAEFEDIMGYHLSLAYRYNAELGDADRALPLAARAISHLVAAARRAEYRGDDPSAASLLRAALAMPMEPRLAITGRIRLATVVGRIGRGDEAVRSAGDAFERALVLDDLGLIARARACRLDVDYVTGRTDDFQAEAIAEAGRALQEATAAGDELALAAATAMLSQQAYMDGRLGESMHFQRQALDHARRGGDEQLATEFELMTMTLAMVGTTPAAEIVEIGKSWLERVGTAPSLRAEVVRLLGIAEAMIGRHDMALAHSLEAVAISRELGQPQPGVTALGDVCWVHRLAGDLDAAEQAARGAYALAASVSDRSTVSWAACRLAQVLAEAGRLDEAQAFLVEAEKLPIFHNRTRVLGIRARILASRGEEVDARRAVDELVVAVAGIEMPNIQLDGHLDAAETLETLGDREAARGHASEALRFAVAKGNVARAAQVEAIIDRLGAR